LLKNIKLSIGKSSVLVYHVFYMEITKIFRKVKNVLS